MIETSGKFDLESFVCNLLRDDTATASEELLRVSEEARQSLRMTQDWSKAMLRVQVVIPEDPNGLLQMPNELISSSLPDLFHERIHYWQILGYPIFQIRFLYLLERLRGRIEDRGGRAEAIAGITAGPHASDRAILECVWKRVSHQLQATEAPRIVFRAKENGKYCQFEYGLIGTEEGTETPYAGMTLDLARTGESVRVPFDALHLMEGAVSVSEALRNNAEPPRVDSCRKMDLPYWGCWLYWQEKHAECGLDQTGLMTAFLAAVDLALMGDCALVHDADFADRYEEYINELSVSKRFATICEVPIPEPFASGTNDNLAIRIEAYQNALAQELGWRTPTDVSGAQMLRLTRILAAFLFRPQSGIVTKGSQAGRRLLNLSIRQWQDALDDCGIIWTEVTDRIRRFDLGFIGYRSLAMILNYTVDRILHAGEHAVPHVYFHSLLNRFPLPLINFGGIYFKDFIFSALDEIYQNHPIGIIPADVASDCTQLASIAPMALDNDGTKCGLIDQHGQSKCFYVSAGLGCPHPTQELSEQHSEARRQLNIHNFCHWTFTLMKADVADASTRHYWLSRWQKQE